jgi:predicted amidohydrolase
MNVLGLQIEIAWENKEANFETVRRLMTTAAPEKGTLVVLPEMFATGFTMNADAMAEPYGGKTEQFLSNLASKWAVHVIAGAAMRGGNGQVRNKALVFSPDGKLAGFYAKMRPFTPGGEAEYYAAGTGPLVLALGDCTVSPFVCYDLRFPELFRLQARAIENQAYVLGVNRIGNDPFYHYPGRSMLADFNGDILSDAGEQEGWLTARLDLGLLRQYRHGLPFLKDLKPVKIGAAGE